MAAFMVGKSLKARRQNEAIGKLFDEAGMVEFPNWPTLSKIIVQIKTTCYN